MWNIDTFQLIKTTKFCSNASKLFLSLKFNRHDLLLVAGLDLKLYDSSLNLIEEFFRKTNDNSIKFVVSPVESQFIVASNCDIELYHICSVKSSASNLEISNEHFEESVRVKEFKKVKNAHKDSILCLTVVSSKITY